MSIELVLTLFTLACGAVGFLFVRWMNSREEQTEELERRVTLVEKRQDSMEGAFVKHLTCDKKHMDIQKNDKTVAQHILVLEKDVKELRQNAQKDSKRETNRYE